MVGKISEKKILYHGLVTAICILCFYNSLENGFVHDDVFAIKTNKDIQPETPISNILTNDFWGRSLKDLKSHKSFRPLCTLTFRLNYFLDKLNPYGYHLVNLMLHVIVCNLYMFVLCTTIFRKMMPSVLAASIFASHPVHVEAVTGVVGRADVLSCLLFLISFYCYDRHLQDKKESASFFTQNFLWSLVCGSCTFFVKEHSVMVLLVCIGYDILLHKDLVLRKFLQSTKNNNNESNIDKNEINGFLELVKRIAFVLVCFGILFQVRMHLMDFTLPTFKDEDNPASFSPHLTTRVLTYLYLIVFNLKLLISPSTLCYDWQIGSIPLVETLADTRNLETALMLFAFGVLLYGILKWFFTEEEEDNGEQKAIIVGLLFLIIPFLPASNFFIRVGFVVAERILYIPSLGFLIIVVTGYERLLKLCKASIFVNMCYMAIIMVVVLFSLKTIAYNKVWYSRETLFRSGIETLPHNAKAHYNYANFLKDVNRPLEAIHHYKQAVRLYPAHSSSHNNLGTLLQDMKKIQDAGIHFEQAIRYTPGHYRAMLNLAGVYREQGKFLEAFEMLQKCLRLKPSYFDAKYLLADTLHKMGRSNESLEMYKTLIAEQKNNDGLYQNYAALLQDLGMYDRAISVYTSLLTKEPKSSSLLTNLAIAYQKAGHYKMTIQLYKRVIDYHPQHPKAYQNLAAFYYKRGELDHAKDVYEQLLQLPRPSEQHFRNYAVVLFAMKKQHKAIAVVENMLSKTPTSLATYYLLINFLIEIGDTEKAEKAIGYALKLSPRDNQVLLHKGNLRRNSQSYDEAETIYKLLIESNSKDFDALMNLGTIYHIQKRYDEAMKYYQSAIKVNPNSSVLLENIKKLKRLKNDY